MGAEILAFFLGSLSILLILLGVYGSNMDAKMMIFTPVISLASGVFLMAFYVNVLKKLSGIWFLWGNLWSRKDLQLSALLRAFVVEVLFQRKLYRNDRIRWMRHILIYWGYGGLWLLDLVFFLSIKIMHLPPENRFRLFLDFGLDLYGGILLVGLIMALLRAYAVRESKSTMYNDTISVGLILLVVVTGFLLEAVRLASSPYESYFAWSFVGLAFASSLRGLNLPLLTLHEGLWIFHAVIASLSIAYIPFSRLVHIFAVPLGRLIESQQKLLVAKVRSLGNGLMRD